MTYTDFADLQANEPQANWRIRMFDRHHPIAVVAIHGGGIETGTSELARAIAGEEVDGPKWSEYRFEGLKSSGNSVLHITSTDFDEPNLLWLLKQTARVVSLHGSAGSTPEVYVGGLDTFVRDRIVDGLNAAGFAAEVSSGDIAGVDPLNVCNRSSAGGVQLELTTALRTAMFDVNTSAGRWGSRTDTFYDFVRTVRAAVAVDEYALG